MNGLLSVSLFITQSSAFYSSA